MIFSSENGADFKYALEAARHCHLLIELGALRKIGKTVKILNLKTSAPLSLAAPMSFGV